MAMFFYDAPSADEMRATFKKHAEEGRKYMLAIEDFCNNELIVEGRLFTKAVNDLQEIVPLLQSLSASTYAPDYRLRAVFDLGKDYEAQKTQAYDVKNLLKASLGDCLDQHGRLKPGPLVSPY